MFEDLHIQFRAIQSSVVKWVILSMFGDLHTGKEILEPISGSLGGGIEIIILVSSRSELKACVVVLSNPSARWPGEETLSHELHIIPCYSLPAPTRTIDVAESTLRLETMRPEV